VYLFSYYRYYIHYPGLNEYKRKVNPTKLELVWSPAFIFTLVDREATVFITKSALLLHVFVALLIIKIFNDMLLFFEEFGVCCLRIALHTLKFSDVND
jgi:hypothetical protein